MRIGALLVANRGEIAVRIARTARRLGIVTVGVASAADEGAPHMAAFDRVVRIGGERAADSYLRIDKLLGAARAGGADAVHPGYGFLSENADFADAVREAGLTWVGPPPQAMRAMADKAAARRHAAALGVGVVPGYDGEANDSATLVREAARIGWPLLVKAAAGGGGRGMRVVRDPADLASALASAAAEAEAAFGNARLVLERYVEGARHVEIQVFGDAQGDVIHLGERDCSVQRRHQKLIEEAPAPGLGGELRRRMGDAAVALARSVAYEGAGTVEFLLDAAGAFHFIEMNTRLQVEHAVTEALLGVDLVEWQLAVATGDPLPLTQAEALARFEAGGHAIEARLCAEDPAAGDLPQSGRIVRFEPPPAVRCDHALRDGAVASAFYDSMLAKIVVHAPDRTKAREQLAAALDATVCLGVATNRAFLARIVRHPVFAAGGAGTGFLELGQPSRAAEPAPPLEALAAASLALLPRAPLPPAWHGWSSQPEVDQVVPLRIGEVDRTWRLTGRRGGALVARHADGTHRLDDLRLLRRDDIGGEVEAIVDGRLLRAVFAADGDAGWWLAAGAEIAVLDRRLASSRAAVDAGDAGLVAPMHGRVTQVLVAAGGDVERGALLVVIEAMKMEHQVRAPRRGRVAGVHARPGDQVAARQRLVELE